MCIRLWRAARAGSTLLLLLSTSPWAPLAGQSCRPANDTTQALIQDLVIWSTTTDTMKVRLRDTKFMIPVVPTSTLKVVTNAKVCTQAAQAYARELGSSPSTSVFVIQMGSGSTIYYAVFDTPAADAHFANLMIFDRQWNPHGGYSW